MASDLQSLEQALLSDPFNSELRLQYTTALQNANRLLDAMQQFELLLKTEPKNASIQVLCASCELASGNENAALSRYKAARNLDGFVADETLEGLLAKAQNTGPNLSVIAGGGENVRQMSSRGEKDTHFEDVAGMAALKKMLRLQIIEPFRNPGLFQRFQKKAGGGVLLYGPPGCGKTLIARAIAGECNAEFQSIGISDVLNMWIGESERNLAAVFEQARSRRPCVMFFDELDALAYSRSKTSSSAARTVVNEFLAQLDGFSDDNEGVLVLAATNMPWDVDPAMKRPGRFSRQIFVPPPDEVARADMFRNKLRDVPADDIDFVSLAAATILYSGADIDGLIDIAKDLVLAEILDGGDERALANADILQALNEATPSTLEWLKTARNLVRYSGSDNSYKDVEKFLKKTKRI